MTKVNKKGYRHYEFFIYLEAAGVFLSGVNRDDITEKISVLIFGL